MVMKDNLILGGRHTMQYTGHVSWKCIPETYTIHWINVTPIKVIFKKEEKDVPHAGHQVSFLSAFPSTSDGCSWQQGPSWWHNHRMEWSWNLASAWREASPCLNSCLNYNMNENKVQPVVFKPLHTGTYWYCRVSLS